MTRSIALWAALEGEEGRQPLHQPWYFYNERNLELEAGLKALLEKYDQEMFYFPNKIEALEEK